jgi:integrase
MSILEEIRIQSQNSRWLFPSPRTSEKAMIPTSFNHALKRHIDKLGVGESFRPHDLRRTAETRMTSMGISRLAVGKILNHAEQSATAIYDRHGYDDEKRMALDAWGRKLEGIISGENAAKVIPLIRKEVNG